MTEFPYELEVLSQAKNYQKWMIDEVKPFFGNRILELGSGMGNLSQWLPLRELLALTEADESLFHFLSTRFEKDKKLNQFEILKINLDHPFAEQIESLHIDTLVSFNVMEHIENDFAALKEQVQSLKMSKAKGTKRVIVVVPAHGFAFGSFDRLFNHFRRYQAKDLETIFKRIDPEIKVQTWYFNLLSLPGWMIAGRVLKQTQFNSFQMKIVELLIPIWKPFDRILHHFFKVPFGQSVIAIAEIKSS